jgi:chromosomal replication initiation ATPase DnaA
MPRLDIEDKLPPTSVQEAQARRIAVRERLRAAALPAMQMQRPVGTADLLPRPAGAAALSVSSLPDQVGTDQAIAEIVGSLAAHLKIDPHALLTGIKDPVAIEARRVAAALAALWLKLPRERVADHFGILEGAVADGLKRVNLILLRYAISARSPRSDAIGIVVRELISSGSLARALSVSEIQRVICEIFDIAPHELISERRTKSVVLPRQLGMALAKRLTGRSLPDIGRKFGGRDHTTVLYAIKKVAPIMNRAEAMLAPSADLSEWVRALKLATDR